MVNQLHLLRRRVHHLAVDLQLIVGQIDAELIIFNFFHLVLIVLPKAAQHRFDARDHFFCLKRLDHIVVRAELQAQDLIKDLALCRQHDDRALRFFPDLTAHLPAVQFRQHDVQHNQVWVFLLEHFQGLPPVVCNDYFEPLFFNIEAQQFTDILIVVHHQDFSRCHK